MTGQGRTVIIGLDGVPYSLLQDLAARGIMPSFNRLIQKSFFTPIRSTVPAISSVAWSSIITGKNPAEHGIFGFMDTTPGSYRISFPNFNSLQCDPFWINSNERWVIINVPSTFPVKEMNGVHISGFVSLDMERSVYPQSLITQLKEFDYRIDVESEKAQASLELFCKDLDDTLSAREKTAKYLWRTENWNTFMLVFTGTDRLMHFLWNAYEDPSHTFHETFLNHFRRIDRIIADFVAELTENDLLILLSDHGFERLDMNIYINSILKKEGFLDGQVNSFGTIGTSTNAFSLDPARIYINTAENYPRAGVSEEDRPRVVRELKQLFDSYEINGKRICAHVFTKEDVFQGPLVGRAPDLVLIAAQGVNFQSQLGQEDLFTNDTIFTGKHTYDNAFMLVHNSPVKDFSSDSLTVTDVLSIIGKMQNKKGRDT